jgi:hypothetical protein
MTSDITAEWHCFQYILSVHTQIFIKLSLSGIDHLSFLLARNIQYKLMCNIFIPLDLYNGSLIQNGKFKEKGKHKLRSIPQLPTSMSCMKDKLQHKCKYDSYMQFGFIYIVTKHYKIVPWFPQNYTGITDKHADCKNKSNTFLNCSILTNCSINLSIAHEHSPSTNHSNQMHESNTSTCIMEATQSTLTCSLHIQLGLTEPKN